MAESMIGRTVWKETDAYGRGERWREYKVTGETSRSWIVGERKWHQFKIAKKGNHRGWAFTEKERDDRDWVDRNSHHIARLVDRYIDPDTLRAIAALVGYVEKTP